MVDRSGKDELILFENHADTSEQGAFFTTPAGPSASIESERNINSTAFAVVEPVGNDAHIALLKESATEHIVLESRSFISKATDVDDHDSVRQIPLSRLEQGEVPLSHQQYSLCS